MNRRQFLKVAGAAGVAIAAGIGLVGIPDLLRLLNTTTSSNSTNTSSTGPPVSIQSLLKRVVQARVYQSEAWTLSSQTPQSVGSVLAGLNPSLVHTILSINSLTQLNSEIINDYNTIRNLVLQSNPNAKFSVMLYANNYFSVSDAESKVESVVQSIPVDLIHWDFLSTEYGADPQTWDSVIDYCHSLGKIVSGHIWGANEIPPNIDFISTDDINDGSGAGSPSNFVLREPLMQNFTTTGKLTLLEVNNNPQNGSTTSNLCYEYQDVWTTQQREQYIMGRAQGQSQSPNYSFAYPVFFPNFPANFAHDSQIDDELGAFISSTMNQYNS